MSQNSAIEWTESTWNPVRGCTKVSPGCANCYAETFAERWRGVPGHAYEQGFDLRLVPEKLEEPLRRKKPTTYFVNSMSDLFQEGVPDDYIDRVFAVMALAPQHTFQVLTKRAERMRAYCATGSRAQWIQQAMDRIPGHRHLLTWPLPNVWLGVSVENQHFADERIPLLLQTPAAIRFISAEPLLEDIHLLRYLRAPGPPNPPASKRNYLDWIIVGGESGPGARPFDLAWARVIIKQCRLASVPVFIKQLGANPLRLDGDHVPFHSRKGADPAEWPEDLRVREMPTVSR